MTFCVILVTLVLQGLTLPPLIRLLGLASTHENNQEELAARREIVAAAVAYLETTQTRKDQLDPAIYKEIMRMYRRRLEVLHEIGEDESEKDHQLHVALRERRLDAMRDVVQVERQTALRLRNEGKIGDETLRKLQYELDLTETRLAAIR
jgi:CPA1 family monovalent cation:H+ antiporter